MTKKKIVFNLTIKDLKDLGIIKRHKKRKNKKSKLNKLINQNIKSSSDHMTTSFASSLTPPIMQTNNLMTENLRLQNEKLQNDRLMDTNSNLLRIKDDDFKNKLENNLKLTDYMLRGLHNNSFNNTLNKSTGLSDGPIIEEIEDDFPEDNIDVPTTDG
jgi:hypothetical protein